MYFYPRSPCGERPLGIPRVFSSLGYFYPRSPCGERRQSSAKSTPEEANFYPRSPCGERLRQRLIEFGKFNFYPRSPCGERPERSIQCFPDWHFYPRSPCGERHFRFIAWKRTLQISIHALLAESDTTWKIEKTIDGEFLSTLSLRRATIF